MTKIGFIGLGHMGNPMVKNLIKNNFQVNVFDISHEAVKALAKEGAVASYSLSELAKNSDAVITMLQTGDQVRQVCLGTDGIFANLKPNALYIDSSSIDVSDSREIHKKAKSFDIAMIDAPVSGGVAAAGAASLTFMVGGEATDFDRAKSILSAMGKKIIYAGKAGSGAAAKICNNMILAISMVGVSEAFVLAKKLGLDTKKLFEISSNASGQCWSLTSYCPAPGVMPNVPSSNNYKPGFTAKMMLKDLELSQDAASSTHAYTPLGQHVMALYKAFVESGNAEVDFSGIIQMLEGEFGGN